MIYYSFNITFYNGSLNTANPIVRFKNYSYYPGIMPNEIIVFEVIFNESSLIKIVFCS